LSLPQAGRGPLRIFLTAGEPSGDQLGAGLMRDLRCAEPDCEFIGIGGPQMEAAGLSSLFPMSDLSVMGFLPVIRRLPLLLRRIRETAKSITALRPDAVILIDAQDFSKRVARKVRAGAPDIPIIGYVAPTVWAWRPGRARALAPLLDHLLTILPFEPEVLHRLGGPPASYAGHPVMAQIKGRSRRIKAEGEGAMVLLLPGSRRSEIAQLLAVFGEAAAQIAARHAAPVRFVMPVVDHLADQIAALANRWKLPVEIVRGQDAKWEAFFAADAALAASGTVTLELALAGVPMVVGYKVSRIEAAIVRNLAPHLKTIVLPDIALGTETVPFFLQKECEPERLTKALLPLLVPSPQRARQVENFARLRRSMDLPFGKDHVSVAAETVLRFARKERVS
jgi:lipid-A-disaccharide synthase